METTIINFYSTRDAYGCFANFSRHPVTLDGKVWPTSEHFFQAMKFHPHRLDLVEEIRKARTPGDAARAGRDRKKPLRKDWESVKYDVMYRVVLTKFKQHERLRKILLGTKDAGLVEHTKNDSYWGDGGDGSGKNMLGQILMRIRVELNYPHTGRYRGTAIQAEGVTLHPSGPKCFSAEINGDEIDVQQEHDDSWTWMVEVPLDQVHTSMQYRGNIDRSRGDSLKRPEHAIKEALAAIKKLREGEYDERNGAD
jgi:ribA/ribD-fused uncharacterized protein